MKNTIINNGVYENFLAYKKYLYLLDGSQNNKEKYHGYFSDKELDECFKIYNATRQRKRNNWLELCKWVYAINYIPGYKDKRLIFGTLTFNDETLAKTSPRTRQRYITWFLKDRSLHYIANIDFGKKNNREHYHFIALVSGKLSCKDWIYGRSNFKFVALEKEDLKRTKNYLLKLNNHSYKDTTRQSRIIRDRKDNYIDKFISTIGDYSFKKFKLFLDYYE